MSIFSKWMAKHWGSVLARPQRNRRRNNQRKYCPALFQVDVLEDRTLLSAGMGGDDVITLEDQFKIAHETNGGPSLADWTRFGTTVAAIGDLNHDGVTDFAVGAPGGLGSVHILFMNTDGTVASTARIDQNTTNGPVRGHG